MSETIHLRAGRLTAEIVPAIGGSLASLAYDGVHILLPRRGDAPTDMAMFPMVPWANRLAPGTRFGDGTLVSNVPRDTCPIHGFGWTRPWRTETTELAGHRAVLQCDVSHGGATLLAALDYALDEAGLTARLDLRHDGGPALHVGLGLHPYIVRRDARMVFAAQCVWLEGLDKRPLERVMPPPELNFTRGADLGGVRRNLAYEGWSGRARVFWPSEELALELTAEVAAPRETVRPAGYAHLWVPAEGGFFCLEPQTHLSGHLDPQSGSTLLAAGEVLSLAVRFAVSASASRH